MTVLIRLAERVEGLAGLDREVDGLIACAIFKTVKTDDDLIYLSPICKSDECATGTYWLVQRSGRSLQTAPSYTDSLDAAMTLVPEGFAWTLATIGTENFTFWCSIGFPDEDAGSYQARSPTPALALTAAALRAIEAHRGQQ